PLKDAPDAVEAMAELEHQRWERERRAEGFRFGPRRGPRRNELLVPWTELPERERERDRDFVRRRPEILAQAGFKLARDGTREELARRLHEEYVAARDAKGEGGPLAVRWDELPETARDYNRAAVDHIAVNLARIACRAVPRVLVPQPKTSFTDAELEQMAEL